MVTDYNVYAVTVPSGDASVRVEHIATGFDVEGGHLRFFGGNYKPIYTAAYAPGAWSLVQYDRPFRPEEVDLSASALSAQATQEAASFKREMDKSATEKLRWSL